MFQSLPSENVTDCIETICFESRKMQVGVFEKEWPVHKGDIVTVPVLSIDWVEGTWILRWHFRPAIEIDPSENYSAVSVISKYTKVVNCQV